MGAGQTLKEILGSIPFFTLKNFKDFANQVSIYYLHKYRAACTIFTAL
jgi:hypothetical protein